MLIPKLPLLCVLLLIASTGFAQVSADSVAALKKQKQYLELSKRINEDKIHLAKLQNSVDKKSREAVDAADDARKAAGQSANAASRSGSHPDDQSDSKKAAKTAHQAERRAKKARRATDDLNDLKKEIESLKNRIAADEAKLAAFH